MTKKQWNSIVPRLMVRVISKYRLQVDVSAAVWKGNTKAPRRSRSGDRFILK
ncbi:hypothetical protein [Bacillus sp. XT-2]|uniref:hypothetical protein n=1 Tax=Bacillus sp. XT-2 TaxID=2856852 RepID=UPI0021E14181|nr:hypothetical protein [Bacillus sp. XT-2]MCV0024758.1 hypothetical protein [Bacillus sp. XT-2]